MTTAYSAEVTDEANKHPTLGAEYFDAREAAERFLAHWQTEHAEELATAIMKPVLDIVQEKVWDAFRDFLLMDTEQNIQGYMRDMVERTVRALLTGEQWALKQYPMAQYHDGEKIREAVAKHGGEPLLMARIADLEKEVARLTESLRYARREY